MKVARGEGALIEKYAPMKFSELLPTFKIEGLKKMLQTRGNRIFLFDGPAGTGKTSASRVLSLFVNCLDEESHSKGEPCLECANCKTIMNGSAIDIRVETERGIDNIRALTESSATYPWQLKSKIYILDECHRLTVEAQKHLLKFLERPQDHVYFIFCTTDPKDLIPQIRDERCQRFVFKHLKMDQLVSLISDVAKAEHPTHKDLPVKDAKEIALLSEGSPRRALQQLEKFWVGALEKTPDDEEATDVVRLLSKALIGGEWLTVARFMSSSDQDPEEVRVNTSSYIRGMLLRENTPDKQLRLVGILKSLSGTISGIKPDKKNQLAIKLYEACL